MRLALHRYSTMVSTFVSFCCLCNNQSSIVVPCSYCRHKDNIPLALQRYEELSSRRAAQLLDYSRQAASSRRRTLIVLFWCCCGRCGSSSAEPRHAASCAAPVLVGCQLLLALAICPLIRCTCACAPSRPAPKCRPLPNSVSSKSLGQWITSLAKQLLFACVASQWASAPLVR
jgi:hypothetical protein